MLTPFASDIRSALDALRETTGRNFSALAWKDANGYTVRWRYASGATNERYRRIVLQPGQGIAGAVLRTERPVQVNGLELRSGEDPRQYAIMLAEGLQSAAAAPVFVAGVVSGVALLGSREPKRFAESELAAVRAAAACIAAAVEARGPDRASTIAT
jgi:nitrogen regulatory protein A